MQRQGERNYSRLLRLTVLVASVVKQILWRSFGDFSRRPHVIRASNPSLPITDNAKSVWPTPTQFDSTTTQSSSYHIIRKKKITFCLVTSKLRGNFYLNLSSKEKWSHQSTTRRRSSSKQYVRHRLIHLSGTLRYRHSRCRVIEGHRKQSLSSSYHRWPTEHHTRRQDHHFKWRYHSWRFEANGSRTCGRNFFGEILSCWRGLHYAVCTPHREYAPIFLTADD